VRSCAGLLAALKQMRISISNEKKSFNRGLMHYLRAQFFDRKSKCAGVILPQTRPTEWLNGKIHQGSARNKAAGNEADSTVKAY
jgi:hypothetical protein